MFVGLDLLVVSGMLLPGNSNNLAVWRTCWFGSLWMFHVFAQTICLVRGCMFLCVCCLCACLRPCWDVCFPVCLVASLFEFLFVCMHACMHVCLRACP